MSTNFEALPEYAKEDNKSSPSPNISPKRRITRPRIALVVAFILVLVVSSVIYFQNYANYKPARNWDIIYDEEWFPRCFTGRDLRDIALWGGSRAKSKILREKCSASIPWNREADYVYSIEQSNVTINVGCLVGGGKVTIKKSSDGARGKISISPYVSNDALHNQIKINTNITETSYNLNVTTDILDFKDSCVNVNITILVPENAKSLKIVFPNGDFDISELQMGMLTLYSFRSNVVAKA
ncbi:uncharacterized protein VTP21DRAFT_7486 [Calcarisporiella thermophila]|uniref:uncharacterized protein n=1 Tax=Calcarisporiella thermophila TaxID=911321 RepID=UPI003742F042